MAKPLTPKKITIASAFSKAADNYDDYAFIEQNIGSRLLARLATIKIQPRYILDLGCGTGFFSQQLKILFPHATIIGLDIAFGMVNFATKASRGYLCCGDAEQLPFVSNQFDLVFANCCLPSFQDPTQFFNEAKRVLALEGLLLFSTFGPATLTELGIDLTTHEMHQLGDLLLAQQYKDPVVDSEKLTFNYNTLQTLLEDLHFSGSFDIDFKAIVERNKPLTVTYEVVYGHAIKSANISQFSDDTGNTYIPLSSLKVLDY